MKKFSIFLILSWVIACSALQVYEGNHSQVVPVSDREYTFSYNTGLDDFHFYGSDVWAVRFDFRDIYISTSEFSVVKALLYLPQTTDSVRVEMFTEVAGMPGTSLAWEKVPVISNYLEVPFATAVQDSILWMIVTYSTNFANKYVSASTGDGFHSYYWNTNVANPYFQSFASAGYGAELLFGLAGDFVMSGVDLELMDYDLVGVLQPRELVGHTFKIYNHSDAAVTDAVVSVNVYSPDPDFSLFDPIILTDPIPPRSMYEFTAQSAGFSEHQFTLPARPMQLKLRAALTSGMQGDPQANNVLLLHRFCLDEQYPILLTENFLRYDTSVLITALQDQIVFQDFHTLNYFPILSDTLGNVPAQIRFNWYDFNSIPRTVVNGESRINGFSVDYAAQFEAICELAETQKTFVSSSDCRLSYDPDTDLLTANLTLDNSNTMLYNSATEYNLISQLRLNVGLFKREQFDEADRYVISRWITHAATLDGTLGLGESYSSEFNIPLNYISLDELNQNYRLYYWLQFADGSKIMYSDWTGFDTIVSNSDELLESPRLFVTPNPLTNGSSMQVKLINGYAIEGLQIFNIKGQKIMHLNHITNEISLNSDQFPASGVYFIRITGKAGNGIPIVINKKISVIR